MPSIKDTIELVRVIHSGETDKSGQPYWLHPVRVMFRLGPTATLAEAHAALFHDAVKAGAITVADLVRLHYSDETIAINQLLVTLCAG